MLKDKTLRELLENPVIAAIAPDAIKGRDLSEEEFYDWTLQQIADEMGWRSLEKGFTKLFEVAEKGDYYYKLYSEEECKESPTRENANFVYFPSKDAGAGERPYILLVPGGGFFNVWNLTEGWPIARYFNELGYHVFILTYQVGVEIAGCAVKAMEDMARAIEIIASRKEQFQVNPNNYITCGFSAGGYIVCLWNTKKGYRAFNLQKPKACFPIYSLTSYAILENEMNEWVSWEGINDLVYRGVGCSVEEARNSCFEIPSNAEGFPPTALFLAAEDRMVLPEHSKRLAAALGRLGIPCKMEIGPTGGHGFACGVGMCMEGWPARAIKWYEEVAVQYNREALGEAASEEVREISQKLMEQNREAYKVLAKGPVRMKRLKNDHFLMLHSQLLEETGGTAGVRDYGLLESAIETPFQEFAGEELYPTILEKAARLGYGLIKNHCMMDGNKRIGIHSLLVFLELNDIKLTYTQKELQEMVFSVADGSWEYEDVLEWLREHQVV